MHEDTLPPARHELTDVGAPFIWIGAPLIVIVVLLLALLVFWIFPGAMLQHILQPPFPEFPAPRLQSNPREDLTEFRKQKLRRLNSTGWIDKANGIAHIPVADAMRRVAQQGVPDWPAQPEKRP